MEVVGKGRALGAPLEVFKEPRSPQKTDSFILILLGEVQTSENTFSI